MSLSRYVIFAMMLIAMAWVTGCSDDDDPVDPGGPDDPSIKSVVISPESALFASIGEDVQFDAVAFDAAGAVVDTVFVWQSSQPNIVAVGADGAATATGIGTAEIYAMASGVTDTASVTVDLTSGPLIEWTAGGSGDWQNPDNWSGGTVPGDGDVAVINVSGTYTVTMTGDVTVEGFVLGNETGTQTLATDTHTLTFASGGLQEGAELDIAGTVQVLEDVVWNGGSVVGTGNLAIAGGAEMNAIGNPLELEADLVNDGEITLWAGTSLRIRGVLENKTSALMDFQGDAIVAVYDAGELNNAGTINKSEGQDEASIFASSALFTSSGTIDVDSGSLAVSGGTLSGFIDIAGEAIFRQSSDTVIPIIFFNGDGAFEINGRVAFGTYDGQSIKIEHLILDSVGGGAAMSGPASLRVDQSFTWRRGLIGDLYRFTTQFGSLTTFETTGTKQLSGTTWDVIGQVAGDNSVNLSLANGAGISIEHQGRWTQESGGTVTQGLNSSDGIHVLGEFHKMGEGAFVVETPFDCSGTLNLVEGTLTVQGAFNLFDSGIMTGGSTEVPTLATAQLIVVEAESAEMSGTIRPDLDGQPAHMAINGNVDLGSSFALELDVPVNGDIPAESLTFLRGGQVLGGTLELNVIALPGVDAEYRVVSMESGSGTFEVTFTGTNPFEEIIQDERGVLLRR